MSESLLQDGSSPESNGSQGEAARMEWYVLKVQSNREKSIKQNIERRIRMEGMQELFGRIVIPTEKIVETKGGTRKVREQKVLPGYMMIEMILTDESWHLVRSTSGVGDFAGATMKAGESGSRRPLPMPEDEVRRWLGFGVEKPAEQDEQSPRSVVKFDVAVGNHVKVKEGAFENFEGTVDSLDEATGKVKVLIEIFGRPTQFELDHWQVERA